MIQQTNSKELVIGELQIICRELTVLQVRNWLDEASQPASLDAVSAALFKDCTIGDVIRMTSLSADDIDSLRPSQVESVINVCKELNPHFFGLLGRLTNALQARA
ncbi:hypothetical protein [Pseudomonas rhizosphaerae]|uniref:hypothetical protein n=1 Tax=Pseudomonas rhizosphaerae TaxID=216142 RepID=UPI002B48FBC8|nr:hypothetical protein [Pseudomonas rhizosphaerae]MEB2870314.1 hypothetical protein [Pseudomonas rhizosphaerae]